MVCDNQQGLLSKDKIVPVHAVNAYGGSRSTTPLILNLSPEVEVGGKPHASAASNVLEKEKKCFASAQTKTPNH